MSDFQLPPTWAQAAPILERTLQENNASVAQLAGTMKRPLPPRNLIAQGGSLQILLTWNAPQRSADVAGYRVYKDNEGNLVQSINDPNTRQATIAATSNTAVGLYVSSVNPLGKESIKVHVIGKSNTDQIVVTGTGGGTGGTTPSRPPGYPSEPSGGCFSGDTMVRVRGGFKRIDAICVGDEVLTAAGTFRPVLEVHVHPNWTEPMYFMDENGAVTIRHPLLHEGKWKRAHECYPLSRMGQLTCTVYNLTVDSAEKLDMNDAPDTERSFVLENGVVAHNVRARSDK